MWREVPPGGGRREGGNQGGCSVMACYIPLLRHSSLWRNTALQTSAWLMRQGYQIYSSSFHGKSIAVLQCKLGPTQKLPVLLCSLQPKPPGVSPAPQPENFIHSHHLLLPSLSDRKDTDKHCPSSDKASELADKLTASKGSVQQKTSRPGPVKYKCQQGTCPQLKAWMSYTEDSIGSTESSTRLQKIPMWGITDGTQGNQCSQSGHTHTKMRRGGETVGYLK